MKTWYHIYFIIVSSIFTCTRLRPIALLAGLAMDKTRFNINIFQAYKCSWVLTTKAGHNIKKLRETTISLSPTNTLPNFLSERWISLPWDLPDWRVHCIANLCSIHQKLWLLSCPSPNDPSSSSSNWSLASFANGTRFQHQSAQPKSVVMLLRKFLQNLETSFVDMLREISFNNHFIPSKMNFRHLELQETCHMLSCQSRGHLGRLGVQKITANLAISRGSFFCGSEHV